MKMRPLACLVLLLGMAHACLGKKQVLTGAWVDGATPATLAPPVPSERCQCAPDPILPDPACILCFCDTQHEQADLADLPERNTTTCELVGATPTVISYETGAEAKCVCAADPFLKAEQWVLCKCPQAAAAAAAPAVAEQEQEAGVKGEPAPEGVVVPNPEVYTAWPAASRDSPAFSEWAQCDGKYALCSMANCTLDFPGASDSPILLAECGCIAGEDSGLGSESYVDPTYILDEVLATQFANDCPEGANSTGCEGLNATAICKAIVTNTIYGGQYDLVSTYAESPDLGGFDKLCERPKEGGMYAQCMTAACYAREAWDGSPVTCYCPVYKAETYVVGTPKGGDPSCEPNLPYLLSGADVGASSSGGGGGQLNATNPFARES